MRNEAAILATISLVLTIVNITCILIAAIFVLKVRIFLCVFIPFVYVIYLVKNDMQ